jgi:hypothetical protein
MYFDESEDLLEFSITEEKISCDYGVLEYEIDGEGAIVHSISVYRKRLGIGTKLVGLFEDLAMKEDAKFVEVPVSPNKEAIMFWKSLKYKPSTDDAKYWTRKITHSWREDSWDTPQGVVVMEKTFKSKSKKFAK